MHIKVQFLFKKNNHKDDLNFSKNEAVFSKLN